MKKTTAVLLGTALLWGGAALAGEKGHWGYSGEGSPDHWGSLSPDFALCGEGRNQSPVDIKGALETDLPAIEFTITDNDLDLVNNGHTVKASTAAGGSIAVEGMTYKLLQLHFHTPSENTFDGESFPMEAHLVHADDAGNLAVVGVLFKEGAENPFVAKIWEKMPEKKDGTAKNADVKINVGELLPAGRDYYRFNGSLTTPPCSEGVKWMVLKETVEVSKEQVEKFSHTMHGDTNRPVQPLNARLVLQ